jgi:serine/threonine protein kinase
MEITTGLIWGDDDETTTFAKSFNEDLCLIFRFSLDAQLPQSLSRRIAACFHNLPVQDQRQSFADRESMRVAVRSLIHQVWPLCTMDPSIRLQDVVVDINEDPMQQIQWRVCHEAIFTQYVESLLPQCDLFTGNPKVLPGDANTYGYINYSTLALMQILGGRANSQLVRSPEGPGKLYVFKGLDFSFFLGNAVDFPHERDAFYHSLQITSSIPRHPNIITPPELLVVATKLQDPQMFICGTLYPFMKNGSLNGVIEKAEATKMRLPPSEKAKWCHQMALALSHTHFKANTYHMDVKLSNFLLDYNRDLILIDWEQTGASRSTLAPEANGCWDVETNIKPRTDNEASSASASTLIYTKYAGPTRQNLWSWPEWNVFPIWRQECPKALEKAEAFSLGRTMWMLLQQVASIDETEEVSWISWDETTSDIPQSWKEIIARCVDLDPNKRIGLVELTRFWEEARREL